MLRDWFSQTQVYVERANIAAVIRGEGGPQHQYPDLTETDDATPE